MRGFVWKYLLGKLRDVTKYFNTKKDITGMSLESRLYQYFDEINKVLVPYHWSYKLDDIDLDKEDIGQIVIYERFRLRHQEIISVPVLTLPITTLDPTLINEGMINEYKTHFPKETFAREN